LPDVASATRLLDVQADTLSLADGDPVATWTDASGNGYDFTQSGDARPTKQSDGGLPAIQFMSGQWLLGADFADSLESFAVFVVCKGAAGPNVITKVNDPATDVGWGMLSGGRALQAQYDVFDAQILNSLILPDETAYYVFTGEIVSALAAESNIYVNGDSSGQTNGSYGSVSAYSNTEPVRICAAGIDLPSDIHSTLALRAILLYAPAPNASDRAAIEGYLMSKWGISP
jgi:hypothetical protein